MRVKRGLALLIGLLVVSTILSGCKLGKDANAATPATTSSTTATTPPPSAPPTTAPPASAGGAKTGTTTVVDTNGIPVKVPFVSGASVNNGNTRNSVTMPGLNKLLPNCGVLVSWQSLTDCVAKNHAQWFIDGVNTFKPNTGFGWSDVQKWAKAKLPNGKSPEVRVILLTGSKTKLSDAQARSAVTGLISADIAKDMMVVRFTDAAFMNTWHTEGLKPSMTNFADFNNEVRVSLTPLVLNAKGQVLGLNTKLKFSGVFVDCDNVHGTFLLVPKQPNRPVLCPPGTTKAGQPIPAGWVYPEARKGNPDFRDHRRVPRRDWARPCRNPVQAGKIRSLAAHLSGAGGFTIQPAVCS
ncbi:MAG: hypothetical protein ACMG55_08630, partial [Microcoleus sp.]